MRATTSTIPAAVGEWETYLKPIPGPPSLSSVIPDVGGVVGLLAVLMEEDNVSDDGAEAGHTALNNAVRDAIQQIINTRSLSNQDVTDKEIGGFTASIQSKVRDAIVDEQNFFENLWSAINPDDTIGLKAWLWSHDDIDEAMTSAFSQRWSSEGDWEVFGHITATPLCPVNALDSFLKELFDSESASAASDAAAKERMARSPTYAGTDLEPMRKFRDDEYRQLPGLGRWFALAERHASRLIPMMLEEPELRESARQVVEWGNIIAENPDQPLSAQHVEHVERLLQALAAHRHRRARIDARRALSVLQILKGKTNREALALLTELPPARRPSVAGNASAQVVPRRKGAKRASVRRAIDKEGD